MATPKQAHALTSYFVAKSKGRYGLAPKVNRNTARWNWDGMLEDMTEAEARELIDYYFTTQSTNGHTLDWFFYNYDKLLDTKKVIDADQELSARIREDTKRRVEEWRKKHGQD